MPLRPPFMPSGPPPLRPSAPCASTSFSAGTSRILRHSFFSMPSCFSVMSVVSAAASRGIMRMPGPLSTEALLK